MSDISEILMTLLLAINQSFFMGFFFMISSYFSPGSIDRKGPVNYLKDRLKRLGIPLLLYLLVIDPLVRYAAARSDGSQLSLSDHLSRHYSDINNFSAAQLWFVAALLAFSLVYVVWRQLARSSEQQTETTAPDNRRIAMFALTLGIVTFFVRIATPIGDEIPVLSWQPAHFSQYIAMFILGIFAYRRRWFDTITDAQAKTWLYIILGLIVLFPVLFIIGGALDGDLDPFMGGLHWQSLLYCVWEQFMCMGMVISLLAWFRRRFTGQGRLAKAMSSAAYATYVVHAPTIVLLAIALRNHQFSDMGLKYLVVVPFAVGLAFLVGHAVRQLPLASDIL